MAMFGAGGGGHFDPSNWVDKKVYHEVMNNNGSGYYHNNNHKDYKNKNNKLRTGFKIINIVAWIGFLLFIVIKVLIDNQYKYPEKTPLAIEIVFIILPFAWLIISFTIGLIILHFKLKNKNDIKKDNN